MHADNAPRLQCRMIAEGANGPTSLEADAILRARGIPILPDILTNAGGVTVSYFEWVQDLGRLFWGATRSAPSWRRSSTTRSTGCGRSPARRTSLRTAALVTGIRDVSAALEARGLYP